MRARFAEWMVFPAWLGMRKARPPEPGSARREAPYARNARPQSGAAAQRPFERRLREQGGSTRGKQGFPVCYYSSPGVLMMRQIM